MCRSAVLFLVFGFWFLVWILAMIDLCWAFMRISRAQVLTSNGLFCGQSPMRTLTLQVYTWLRSPSSINVPNPSRVGWYRNLCPVNGRLDPYGHLARADLSTTQSLPPSANPSRPNGYCDYICQELHLRFHCIKSWKHQMNSA